MAQNTMERWYNAAKQRVSVREFTGAVSKETFFDLKGFVEQFNNDEARLELRAKNGVLDSAFPFSLLGGVSGTNCFAAVISRDRNDYMAGYLGEAFVLECAARGIGTCWLGLNYKRKLAKQFISLDEGERLVGVIAFGKYSGAPHSPSKKSLEQLTGLGRDAFHKLPLWQQEAARIAKLAPSARNRQPYEIEFDDHVIGIVNNSSNFGFGGVDVGIAMLHLELGAAHQGVYGDWDIDAPMKLFNSYAETENTHKDDAEDVPAVTVPQDADTGSGIRHDVITDPSAQDNQEFRSAEDNA